MVKVAKITASNTSPGKTSFPLFSKIVVKVAEISFREIGNYTHKLSNYASVAIVIRKTKMAALKYKQQENESGSCIISGYQLLSIVFYATL